MQESRKTKNQNIKFDRKYFTQMKNESECEIMSVNEAVPQDTKETEETENLPPKPHSRIKGCLKCTCLTCLFIFLSFAIFAAVMGGIVSNLSTGNIQFNQIF